MRQRILTLKMALLPPPISLQDYRLRPGGLDDIVVFCRIHDERFAVVTGRYGASKDCLVRLLKRCGATGHVANLGSNVANLRDLGSVLTHDVRHYGLGLMRPWLLGPSPTDAEAPALIAYEPRFLSRRGPIYPVLAQSRTDSQRVMRRLAGVPGIDTGDWRSYECERLLSVWDKLILDLHRGQGVTRFKTDLEQRFSEELDRLGAVASAL